MIIRDAILADSPEITAIYNALIPTTTTAWTDTVQTVEMRKLWMDHQATHDFPVLVADNAGAVIGFASYCHVRGAGVWPGYRHTVEHTIHVSEVAWVQGVGRALISALLERAREADMHAMIGAIDSENETSLRFHTALGFTEVARLPQVGHKFGRWLDLILVHILLGNRNAP